MPKLSPSEEKLVPIKNFLLEHSTYQVTDPFHLEFRAYDDNLIESKEFKELLIQNKTPNSWDSYKYIKKFKFVPQSYYLEQLQYLEDMYIHPKNKKKENTAPRGVYGVYINDELFYIGSTNRSFSVRWAEHETNIALHKNELFWYSRLFPTDKITFKPLIDITQLKVERKLTSDEIKAMELALIDYFKPKGNLAGRTVPFKF